MSKESERGMSQLSHQYEDRRTRSKESIREIRIIRKREEEKSRMLNTFIPRPSYSKWVQKKDHTLLKNKGYTKETSSEESDYYSTESEQEQVTKVNKPNIKLGRLSTVKEQIDISHQLMQNYQRKLSGDDDRKFLLVLLMQPVENYSPS